MLHFHLSSNILNPLQIGQWWGRCSRRALPASEKLDEVSSQHVWTSQPEDSNTAQSIQVRPQSPVPSSFTTNVPLRIFRRESFQSEKSQKSQSSVQTISSKDIKDPTVEAKLEEVFSIPLEEVLSSVSQTISLKEAEQQQQQLRQEYERKFMAMQAQLAAEREKLAAEQKQKIEQYRQLMALSLQHQREKSLRQKFEMELEQEQRRKQFELLQRSASDANTQAQKKAELHHPQAKKPISLPTLQKPHKSTELKARKRSLPTTLNMEEIKENHEEHVDEVTHSAPNKKSGGEFEFVFLEL